MRSKVEKDLEKKYSTETIYQSLYVQSRGALKRELTACLRTGRAVRRPSRKVGQRSWTRSMSSPWPATHWTAAANASNKTRAGNRGRTGDPLYGIRRVLRTGTDLLTDKQRTRLTAVFANDEHVQVEATWGIYQRIVAAYRDRDRAAAKTELKTIIDAVGKGVPPALTELITLGRTLNRRTADVLAYFDRPHTSNGPTEAINGRLEHLRGTALGFRNLTNYITRSLLDTGGFRPRIHPLLR